MNPKQRFLKILRGEMPDRLPVTTHHIMPSYLDRYMNGGTDQDFFKHFGIDPIQWIIAYAPDESKGEFYDPEHTELGFLEAYRISSDNWQFKLEKLEGYKYETTRFSIITPRKTLSMVLQSDEHTTWISEYLIKDKSDIDIIEEFMTCPLCDVKSINAVAQDYGDKGLIRGHICCFDGFGQPGCWQDLACIYGIENLIMDALQDPDWVHNALRVLQSRKLVYVDSMKGANYDILELGGGDASTTVISPDIFETFVAPYDSEVISHIHQAGQRVAYHTCGGMMPILEQIADMGPDAMETFTPEGMGGDVNLSEAKKRIGDRVCMIGGFDQFHFFMDCNPADTRKEVRRCFQEAGEGGGYILSPSDHFFDAEPELIQAFADEAKKCVY